MRVCIDAAGRVVIPKRLRDAAWLRPNMPLEVSLHDGRLEPAAINTRLIEEGGSIFIRAEGDDTPPLTTDAVRDVMERLR
jgi:bifunctional DNA-binding transcriptional regulator/antitoxin component of YhaV-PrlF toxin-antitoxin module